MNAADMAAIQRRQRIAEMLMQQGSTPINPVQTAGGYVIPVSPLEGLSKAAQQIAGAWIGKKADTKKAELLQQDLDALSNLDIGSPEAANKLFSMGRIADAISLKKLNAPGGVKGVPTGFTQTSTGEIAPMPISGGGNYMDYQLQLAQQRAAMPSFGERERLQMQYENQAMQRQMAQEQLKQMALNEQSKRQQIEITSAKEKQAEKERQYPKLTEAQAKGAAFASQMQSANTELKNVESSGFDPSSLRAQAATALAGGVTNPLAPADAQQYRQAQEQWAEAYLRFKTGAAATQDEVDRNIRTYFPQIGDSAAVVKQKENARKKAFNDVLMTSGRGQELVKPSAPVPNKSVSATPASDTLTPAEQEELRQLEKEFGGAQ